MKKMLLLFSHNLTEMQIKDGEKSFGIEEYISLNEEMQNIWSNVDPEIESYEKLSSIKNFLLKEFESGDYVLVQGEWGCVVNMVLFCKEYDFIPIYSSSKREYKSEELEDGTVKNVHYFKHKKYKKYFI